jgi:ubiquinone/menaquinone biosynthesis C-methylase UbiE
MSPLLCPWWLGYPLASPARRWFHDPKRILSPYVHEGMTVLEPGPGMGHFTLEMAREVGHSGLVIAVDVQPKMLKVLSKRCLKAGLANRLETRVAKNDDLGVGDLKGKVDFVLAFAMVHELPDIPHFFSQVQKTLKPHARILLAEPKFHVNSTQFSRTLLAAERAGLKAVDHPSIRLSHTALLLKG